MTIPEVLLNAGIHAMRDEGAVQLYKFQLMHVGELGSPERMEELMYGSLVPFALRQVPQESGDSCRHVGTYISEGLPAQLLSISLHCG